MSFRLCPNCALLWSLVVQHGPSSGNQASEEEEDDPPKKRQQHMAEAAQLAAVMRALCLTGRIKGEAATGNGGGGNEALPSQRQQQGQMPQKQSLLNLAKNNQEMDSV